MTTEEIDNLFSARENAIKELIYDLERETRSGHRFNILYDWGKIYLIPEKSIE